jgi:hypothetical protein
MDRAVPLVQEIPYRARGLNRVLQKIFASDATRAGRLCPARVRGALWPAGRRFLGPWRRAYGAPSRPRQSLEKRHIVGENPRNGTPPRATERETVPPRGQRLVRNVDVRAPAGKPPPRTGAPERVSAQLETPRAGRSAAPERPRFAMFTLAASRPGAPERRLPAA